MTATIPTQRQGSTGDSPPAIALVGVAKEYHAHGDVVVAVKRVDLAIAEGEFFSLLGPSGCGKTTTMRMIAGFEEPTRGSVFLRDVDVTDVAPNKRDVNMVFQSYALFPHMSVFDNVAFGLKRKKVPAAEIKRRVGEMLEIVDLVGREKRSPACAFRWPAAAGRGGQGAGQPAPGTVARRTPGRTGPEAAPAHAGRTQTDPARSRSHVRLCDPRPGRGADHVGSDRGDE